MNKTLVFIRIITFSILALIVISILAVNQKQLPGFLRSLYAFPHGDKVMHFILYGILSFLFNMSFPGKGLRVSGLLFPAGSLAILSMAILEEISQFYVDFRTPSFIDLFTGLAGIILLGTPGYFLSSWLFGSQREP